MEPSSNAFEQSVFPPELQASVRRHQQHLVALVTSLRSAGVGEDLIDQGVRQLLESYGSELTSAMRTLVQVPPSV